MKKIFYIISLMLVAYACQEPEYVKPTSNNKGLTSLTVLFTSGEFADKEMVKYNILNDKPQNIEIEIPWFYPEESDNETDKYLNHLRVKAELAPNCIITPPLSVLDLSKINNFKFTDQSGKTSNISISGKRVKSKKCNLLSFSVVSPEISAIIDEEKKVVSLISSDDLSDCLAKVTVSAHASVMPDVTKISQNFNEPVKISVIAHDGITKSDYVIKKEVPNKIAYGFRKESGKKLFNKDLSELNININTPTLGLLQNYLILNNADGQPPIYIDKTTGEKKGLLNVGDLNVNGSIKSDANNNLLLCNYAQNGESLNIYVMKNISEMPKLLCTYLNNEGLPLGSRINVAGNVDGDAIITIPFDGKGNIKSNKFIRWIIRKGQVSKAEIIIPTGVPSWKDKNGNASVVYRTSNINDGYFIASYDDGKNNVYFLNGNSNTVNSHLTAQDNGWARNNNCLATTIFNGAKYLLLNSTPYFQQWGGVSELYLYDVSNTAGFVGPVNKTELLSFNTTLKAFNTKETSSHFGDALLVSVNDGYNLIIYAIDSATKSIYSYTYDCVDK